ncbi:ABC-three component system middle component 5 [Burkholderia sp. 22PA0106]|uniref:ABC-three component system middle component 5 n=1 Tax=Burkholderia sp. 22PA0106 TaxID=3237371 RepID=UPI0039C119E1
MLIYHPAYDAYHCAFRMLVVAESIPELEVDKARLLDFYLLFPASVQFVRLPANLRGAQKIAKSFYNEYHDPLSPATTFRELRQIQQSALRCIAASGLIDIRRLEVGFVRRTDLSLPSDLRSRIKAFLLQRESLADTILFGLGSIPLRGHDGLKHRSKLMEYRYDVA